MPLALALVGIDADLLRRKVITRHHDLLARFVNRHVVDVDRVRVATEEYSDLAVQCVDECSAFECLGSPKREIRLVVEACFTKIKGANDAGLGVTDEDKRRTPQKFAE